MSPVPKRRYAKARQGKRRSNLGLLPPTLAPCPQCHSLRPPHQVCPTCGSYRGREVIKVKTGKKG